MMGQPFYVLPTSGALIAMRLRRILQTSFTVLVLLLVVSQGLFAAGIEEQLERYPGRWTRDRIGIGGEVETWIKTVVAGAEKHEFIETNQVTGANGKTLRQWQVKFRVDPVAGKYLRFQAAGIRSNPPQEGEPWRPNSLQYLLQVDGNFIYEVHDFAYGVFRWQRLGPGAATIDPQRLNALRELLGTFRGDYANAGSEAYGIAPADVTITSSATGSLITQSWKSVPQGKGPEEAFEAHVVYSYDPSSGRIIKQYQTSTGVSVKGTLILWQNRKLLWERSGDTPRGPMYELCLYDFSDAGTFKHVILKRTLNGKMVDVDEDPIVLRRVK